MKLDLYSKISMVHAQATKLIMPNVSLHSPPSLSHSSPFCSAYLSIPFTSSKKADTCTDDVLLQTQSSNSEYNTEGAHMNKDVACTNRMHVQLDLARRKLHWASLTMGIQERQKSFQNTDFMPALWRGGRPCDRHSPGVRFFHAQTTSAKRRKIRMSRCLIRKGMFCMLSAIFYGLFSSDRLI